MSNQQARGSVEKKRPDHKPGKPTINDADYRAIIVEGNTNKLNEKANELGAYLCQDHYSKEQQKKINRLSSSQIRNILDEIQRMQGFDENQLQLLRPKLAYAAGRHRGKVMDLQKVTDEAIKKVTNDAQFENFRHFFEAIVAYHRYHGGE